MQSDEYAAAGLSTPFEYSSPPTALVDNARQPAYGNSNLTNDYFDDPHDFYRRSLSPTSRSSDLFFPDSDGTMASPYNRRNLNPNGKPAKATPPGATATRSALRSVSQPTTSHTSILGTARSHPSLPQSSRPPPGTIKDRIKQIDQSAKVQTGSPASRHGRSCTPPAPKTSATRSFGSSSGSPGRITTRRQEVPSAGRRLLFGEVASPSNEVHDPGYGISVLSPGAEGTHTDKLATPLSQNRSQPNLDSSHPVSASDGGNESPTISHHRAHSEDTTGTAAASKGKLVKAQPGSRIPVTAGRRSIPSDQTLKDVSNGTNASSSAGRNRDRGNGLSAQKENNATKRPTTPLMLSSRRYGSPCPSDTNQTLKAYIKAPVPKDSPPLRSSRPRQPVSSATTNASRARAASRTSKPANEVTTRSSQTSKDTGARPKRIPGQVDVASRAAKWQGKAASGETSASASIRTQRNPNPSTDGSSTDTNSIATSSPDPPDSPKAVEHAPRSNTAAAANRLMLAVNGLPPSSSVRPANAMHGFDVDESPILGRPAEHSNWMAHSHNVESALPTFTSTDQSTPKATFADRGLGAPKDENRSHPLSTKDQLFNHVLKLRQQNSPPTPQSTVLDSTLSRRGDLESIQILLGATPMLAGNERSWHNGSQTSSFPDSSNEDIVEENRCSLRPEDSVSVVFGGRQVRQDFTIDSEARSLINQVLEHYYSGGVTPQMAHGFQQKVAPLSPELAKFDGWNSVEATQLFLQEFLNAKLSSTGVPSQHLKMGFTNGIHDTPKLRQIDEDSSSPGQVSGTAIIYGAPQRYSRESSVSDDSQEPDFRSSNSTVRAKESAGRANGAAAAEYVGGSRYTRSANDLGYDGSDPSSVFRNPFETISNIEGQRLQLPEIEGAGEGLGLSLQSSESAHDPAPFASPPQPTYAPPPPPGLSAETPMAYPIRGRLPPSPSVYSRHPPSSIFPISVPDNAAELQRSYNAEVLNDQQPALFADEGATRSSRSSESSRAQKSLDRARESTEQARSVSTARSDRDGALFKRRNVIKELLDTEYMYSHDMIILEDIYRGTANNIISSDDMRILFGNSDQVRAVSLTVLDALKQAGASVYTIPKSARWNYKRGSFTASVGNDITDPVSVAWSELPTEEKERLDKQTYIGQVFLDNMAQIEKVYNEFLKNQDAANKRLPILQQDQKAALWLEECRKSAEDLTQAWNLDALIVKPIQRLTRYPLVLEQLIRHTPSDHPDYDSLVIAKQELTDATVRINEQKKRTELVEQVMNRRRKESDITKFGVPRLLNRRTEKLKQQVGLSSAAEDQDYEAIAQKFGGHFFQLQIVMRDIEKYLEEVQGYVDWCNRFCSILEIYLNSDKQRFWPEYESKYIAFTQTMREMAIFTLKSHLPAVRKHVIEPISQLWKMHVGPQKMMQKRKKRIVDYSKFRVMKDKGEKMDKKLQESAEQFVAINDTLKDELPKLYVLTRKLVEACLRNLVELQTEWQYAWQKKLSGLPVDNILSDGDMSVAIDRIQAEFQSDFNDPLGYQAVLASFGVCNGSTLADAANFLSPATTFMYDDSSSYKRPSTFNNSKRTMSLNSDQSAALLSPDPTQRHSDNLASSPLVGSFAMQEAYAVAGRARAGSALSSRGPSTPRSAYATPSSSYFPQRPSTATGRSGEPSPGLPRLSVELPSDHGITSNGQYSHFDYAGPGAQSPANRHSGIFSSAMPMPDESPAVTRPVSPLIDRDTPQVLFLAASLFEFNIDGSRREGGFPYLRYVPGEVFDVIGTKGELWLARNQDDDSGLIGWIWEKHFARILPDET